MKRRLIRILIALPIVYGVLLGAQVGLTALHAKSYVSSLSGEYDRTTLDNQSNQVATDVNRIFTLLSVPVVKQIASAAGVDFTPIRDEAVATIKASSWIAGADAPKRYMIAFQNSAEARGTGGILGAFAIVELNKGSLSVVRTGSNALLKSLDTLPIAMPKDFERIYGDDPAIWQNSNISPHYPYGAKIWLALWEKQFGEKLNGVIAVDPSALSYVLKSTGPIKLDTGEIITSDNLVSETLQKTYKRYEFDNLARKDFLVRIINKSAAKLVTGQYSKLGLVQSLVRGIAENRILFYSTDIEVQRVLEETRLGGSLSLTGKNEFRVVIINTDASKLDYYLARRTRVNSIACNKNGGVQVELLLRNTLKTGVGLPSYVLTRADKTRPHALVSGQHRFLAFIYGPPGSSLLSARRSSAFGSAGGLGEERDRPVLVVDIDLAPQQSEKITAVFSRGTGRITYHSQPLVRVEKVAIDDKCG